MTGWQPILHIETMGRMVFVLIGAAFLMAAAVMAQGPGIDMAITGSELAQANQANGGQRARAAAAQLAFTEEKLVVTDSSQESNERVYLVGPDKDPPGLSLLVDEEILKNKVAQFAARPSDLTIRGLKVDSQGNVVIASDDGGGQTAFLFRVNPRSGEVALLSGLDGSPSSIEGLTALAVADTTAYLSLERNFGAISGDSIVKVSTAGPDDGQAAATVFVSETALLSAVREGDIAIRDMGILNGSARVEEINPDMLVAVNSASPNANDDLLAVVLPAGRVFVLVAATEIEADLGVDNIGPSAMAIDPNGTIYLINEFGAGDADNGIIAVLDSVMGTATAILLASEQQIVSAPKVRNISGQPIGSLQFIGGNSLAAPRPGEIFFSEGMTDGVIRIRRR